MGEGLSGWLDPKGMFHPCEYNKHNEYSERVMEELGKGYVTPYESARIIQEMQYIYMSDDKRGYVFFNIDKEVGRPQITEEQLTWFKEHFTELTEQQQEMVGDWFPEVERAGV